MSRGRLIVLEGGEGAGKSTNARFIEAWLRSRGRKTLVTREPGGAPLAEAIREIVLNWQGQMPAQSELLLMFAARAAHIQKTILPALLADIDVVCDRFVDSSHAYQGAGRGVPAPHIDMLEKMVLGELQPDAVFVFDVDPAAGVARAKKRGDANRFEGEDLAFQQRVREAFLERARANPARYSIIDSGRELGIVQAHLQSELEKRL
jgi:dTMP kinase